MSPLSSLGHFSEADLAMIREAVKRAELRSGGEIVTYIVGRCDPYPEARWRGALILGVLFGALACVVHYLRDQWGSDPLFWSLLPVMAGMLIGLLAFSFLPQLERAMIDRRVLERRVRMRAEAAFLEEEVFATRDRTGILLFLGLFEHRALVLGDEGINRKVGFEDWEAIVEPLAEGLRGPNPTAAVVEAVERCGELLAEKKVELRADDVDELDDAPRTRET